MVFALPTPDGISTALSVLALSSRFDGPVPSTTSAPSQALSVLALSSRFDGPSRDIQIVSIPYLSVLALSSRFDGHFQKPSRAFVFVSFSTRSVESF